MSNDFQIFDQIFPKQNNIGQINDKNINNKKCSHDNVVIENGNWACTDCGEEMNKNISMEKEWRYYGNVDTKHSSDPNRCHIRKIEERSIYKDVEKMGFDEKTVSTANRLYLENTNGNIFRGNTRKSIIFACIFHALKLNDTPMSCDTLMERFSLERRVGLKGLKHVSQHAPKNSKVRTTYITPIHIIEEIMNKLNATQEQKNNVIQIYKQVKNRSSMLNRSRPQSISASIIWFYIRQTGRDITMKDYKEIVGLSELTINKIAKEVAHILEVPEIMK